MKTLLAISLFFISALQITTTAQIQTLDFVHMPHSVSSFGMGQNAVAFPTNDDALAYNPAKLSFTNNTKISFFRNSFQMIGMGQYPITNISVYHNSGNYGSFGVTYDNRDWGETILSTIENPGGDGKKFHSYERSFAAGYAKTINSSLSVGAELRYAYINQPDNSPTGLFLSLGLLYNPEFFSNRLTIGFSLMNLGPALKYEITTYRESDMNSQKSSYYVSPPSNLNLGLNLVAAENEFFTLPFAVGFSKPFDKINDKGEGQSSFKSLFNDWNDFPRDATLHTGIAFQWKPLNLGNDFTFIQEFYAGDYSMGPKAGSFYNFYTHGANIGFSYKDFKFTAGYAGVSHNVHYGNFIAWKYPYETFQFALELNDNILFKKADIKKDSPILDKIIISLGFGNLTTIVNNAYHILDVITYPGYYRSADYSVENSFNYSVEASFYFDKDNALISSFYYGSVSYSYGKNWMDLYESKDETFSFFSSYRYHPFEKFHYLYLQGGLGIYRYNPVYNNTYPRYDYKTALQISTGFQLNFLSPLIITPAVDYNLILFRASGESPRISGINQFNFLLKIGYVVL